MVRIVFVCTGNTCRSPMAEALLRGKVSVEGYAGKIDVWSAGIAAGAGGRATRQACEAMRERALSLDAHRSKPFTTEMMQAADLILTMTGAHKAAVQSAVLPERRAKVHTLAEFSGFAREIADPFGGDLAVYRACAKDLAQCIDRMWDKLADMADNA